MIERIFHWIEPTFNSFQYQMLIFDTFEDMYDWNKDRRQVRFKHILKG